jgi:hypothetical protein
VTGRTSSINFPTTNSSANAGGAYDVFVTKFNPSGSALVYSTFLGGSNGEEGKGIAVDSSGNAYVTGLTYSTNFPTVNPIQPAHGGGFYDAFVTKVNSSGSALLYSTFHGGNSDEFGLGIAVDSSGNAYVTGNTCSTNFPTANPIQPNSGGNCDAFVTKFSSPGSPLVYSTYLGGSGADGGYGIDVDSSGNVYVTGSTRSTNFPTANPRQPAYGGGFYDAFVTKFNSSGSAFLYSTYLGGNGSEVGRSIAADSGGNTYVTGDTGSTNFPISNPLQPFSGGGDDAFVTKFDASGSVLIYSTYHGGSGYDYGFGIAADSSGNAYVTGTATSTNFPTANPLQPIYGGGALDVFVTKFNTSGSALIYSTYHGGSNSEQGFGIAVDSSDNAYVTGYTLSTNFPTANPFQPAIADAGANDAFVIKIGEAIAGTTLNVSPTTVFAGGSGTATWANIPNPTAPRMKPKCQ